MLGARLLLAGLSLGLAVSIDRVEASPGGTAIWGVHWTIVGAFMATIVSATMINDRQATDLQRLRDLHLRTVESIGSGLLTTNESGEVTSFNPEAERGTGLHVADAVGRPLDELIPGATAIVAERSGKRGLVKSVGRDRLPYCNERDDDLFLGMAASGLIDADGRQVGHVVIFQDVTDVVVHGAGPPAIRATSGCRRDGCQDGARDS